MNDEEYIEMETRRELHNKKKPVYALRKEDFIPIVGVKKYEERCNRYLMDITNEWLQSKMTPKEALLGLYNTVLIGGAVIGTGFAVSGLVNLLSK